jgi:Glycine zipper 2TM domain
MKKNFTLCSIIAVIAIVITACNRNPDAGANNKVLSYEDTVGFAQFQTWRMQNERLDPNQYYQQAAQKQAPAPVRKAASKSSTNYGSGSMNSGSENTAKTTQKKGWSKAAKGAAIGGGAGAVAGAVINKKNRVIGGVVGGAVGAGIGYVLGRAKDKKDGRY